MLSNFLEGVFFFTNTKILNLLYIGCIEILMETPNLSFKSYCSIVYFFKWSFEIIEIKSCDLNYYNCKNETFCGRSFGDLLYLLGLNRKRWSR